MNDLQRDKTDILFFQGSGPFLSFVCYFCLNSKLDKPCIIQECPSLYIEGEYLEPGPRDKP